MAKPLSIHKKLRPVQLIAVIFLTVSGGPYGLEPLLKDAGSNAAMLLLIITPILWDVPTILTVLELNSMMPVTGGYYQWVKRALGLRFAFYEGWWTWLYTFADLAIYPVLFVQYLSFFYPEAEGYKIPVCLSIIWISALVNILGIVPVGRVSIVLSAVVLIPFIILFGLYLARHNGHLTFPAANLDHAPFSSVGLGLYTIMWNFIGWDNATTYAEEVNKPVRSYIISLFSALLIVFAIYFIALIIAINSGIAPAVLSDEGFPALGTLVGGFGLGAIVAIGGMASAAGLYSAVLLSVSRIPKVMADDKLLPRKLNALHPTFNSPYVSIICCSIVVSGMVIWTFGDLIIIDITLYGAALFLEYIALIRFRKLFPSELRPFKIPLNTWGLVLMTMFPFAVYVIAMSGALIDSGRTIKPLLFSFATLLSAEVTWQIITRRKPRKVN